MILLSDCLYWPAIRAAMTAYLPQWDARWGAAQLFQESGWNAGAVSGAGAKGIAQFLDGTWLDMCEQLNFPTSASPFDVVYAIPAYAHYMASLRKTWSHIPRSEDERRKLAQASYNAGTGNILKAQTLDGGATDYATIIAALPQVTGPDNARQTTEYVRLIQKWYDQLSAQT